MSGEPPSTAREDSAAAEGVGRRASYLVFGSPQFLEEEIDEVVATIRSGWVGTGPRVATFEKAFRDYVGAPNAVAVHSCTAALHLALIALDLEADAEVVVPAMTFPATANAVIHARARPVLVDVERSTMCVEAEAVRAAVTERTRAFIPVHFAGRACDMDPLMEVARGNGLRVIEDCAHAIETLYKGVHAGTFGDYGAFSFYVTKNLVTGEGGMITTRDRASADRIKSLALHGLSADAWRRFSDEGFVQYEVVEPGFKYNMMDIQAALGLHQLRRVEGNLPRRDEIWQRYDEAFADLPLFLQPPPAEGTRHARHLYTVMLDLDRLRAGRDDVQLELHRRNIGTGTHYRALHLHRYYGETYGYRRGDFPNAEWISDRTLSLPLSPKLTDADVEDVVSALTTVLRSFLRPR